MNEKNVKNELVSKSEEEIISNTDQVSDQLLDLSFNNSDPVSDQVPILSNMFIDQVETRYREIMCNIAGM